MTLTPPPSSLSHAHLRKSRFELSAVYLAVVLSLGSLPLTAVGAEDYLGSPDQFSYDLSGDFGDIQIICQEGELISKNAWTGYQLTLTSESADERSSVGDLKLIELSGSPPQNFYQISDNSVNVSGVEFDSNAMAFGTIYTHFSGVVDVSVSRNFFEVRDSVFSNFKGVSIQGAGNHVAENNILEMYGQIAEGGVSGGGRDGNISPIEITQSGTGTAAINANELRLRGGLVTGTAAAGKISLYGEAISGSANDNAVLVDNNSFANQLMAVHLTSYNGGDLTATANTVTYGTTTQSKAGMVTAVYAYGKKAGGMTLKENEVSISSSAPIQRAIGAYAYSEGGGVIESVGNSLEITGEAKIDTAYGTWATSYASSTVAGSVTAQGNSLTADSGTITEAYGGRATSDSLAKSIKNSVGIAGTAEVGTLYGGRSTTRVEGGTAEAVENIVQINGGSVQSLYGGYADTSTNVAAELKSNSNRVELLSGEIKSAVYGGYATGDAKHTETRNNLVFIDKGIDLSNATLYGGSHESTGNVLQVGSFIGDIKSIQNFESIRLNVTERNLGNATALISISEDVDTKTRVDVDVNVAKLPSRETSVLLLSGNDVDQLAQGSINLVDPVYEIEAAFDASVSDELSLTLSGKTVSDDTSVLSSGQIASAMDLDRGIGLLIDYFKDDLNVKKGLFVVAGGGQNEFDDWGSIEASGVNLIFGATGSTDVGAAKLSGSVFFDYGRGDYEADNGGHADGDFEHYGFGLYGKLKYAPVYVEASIRAGFAETEYLSVMNDISVGMSDTRRSYFSTHVGLGGDFVLSEKLTINPFAQYFITRLGSHSEGIENNNIHWDSFIMQKTVLGIGANSRWTERFGTRLNVAWENIFDADSEISFGEGGSRIDDYKGDNLLLQASAQYEPTENVSIGLRIQGRMGDYKGIEGLINAQYLF